MKEARLNGSNIIEHYHKIISNNLWTPADNALILLDFDILNNRIECVQQAFGENATHTVAIKSNPLFEVLKHITSLNFGLEAASFEEVQMATEFEGNVVWDSPAKTKSELKASEQIQHLLINANDLAELHKVVEHTSNAKIGLRINPHLNASQHSSMNVSSEHSKFGESLSNRELIISSIINGPDEICNLHVHTSSQNVDFSSQIKAIRLVIDLALEINKQQPNRIKSIDIGGGFPVGFEATTHFHISDYAHQLKLQCPELFDGRFNLITEFGRYYHANSGVCFSTIESVKHFQNHQTIIHHVGADLLLRESYNREQWPHEIGVIHNNNWSLEQTTNSDIGGPLCFGGDYIEKGMCLPKASAGDVLTISDIGANSFSLWSRHCSRPFPKVIAHNNGNYNVIKEKESLASILNFWR
jgi:diaminopimelate decarboxylase